MIDYTVIIVFLVGILTVGILSCNKKRKYKKKIKKTDTRQLLKD